MKKRTTCLVASVLSLSMMLGCTYSSLLSPYKAATDERPAGAYLDDTIIKEKIEAKILKDKQTRKIFMGTSVSVHRGRAVMVGKIPNKTVGKKAIQIARSTKGVSKVNAYFLPKGSKSTTAADTKIAAKIKGRFLSDIDLKGFQVEVSVVHGHAVLAGLVENKFSKKRCLEHASRVKGVVKVVDFIQVK